MEVVGLLFSIIALIIAAVILLGWVVPLILGLTRFRRTTAGVVLDVVGGLWGLGSLALVGVGYFAYREMSAASRVEEFRPAQYHGPVGTIALSYPGEVECTVRAVGSRSRMRATATDGRLTLPVGEYDLSSCDLRARGPDNRLWTASTYMSSVAFRHVIVAAGASPPPITIGPPFEARVRARAVGGDRVSLSLALTGRDQQSWQVRLKLRG